MICPTREFALARAICVADASASPLVREGIAGAWSATIPQSSAFNSSNRPFSPVTFKSISRRLARAIMELSEENADPMAIELKGLRAKALAARSHLDSINAAYDKFNAAAPAHAAEVGKMATDLGEMQSDLEFATNLLGNSAGASEEDGQNAANTFPPLRTAV